MINKIKKPKAVLKPYQKTGVRLLKKVSTFGLLWKPGLGKTLAILTAFSDLQKKGLVDALYIVAPLNVCILVWPLEVAKWDNFKHLKINVLHGPKKDNLVQEEADVYVMTPDSLPWLLKNTEHLYDNAMLVIDESTKFKATNTLRFKTLKKVLKYFNRRHILTGSPVPNGMLDLFGQLYILDEGASLGKYITHYKNEYFYASGYKGYESILQNGGKERIMKKVKGIVHVLDSKDHLTLPPLITKDIIIELPKKVMGTYKDVKEEMITFLKEGKVIAGNAAVVTSKCRQIANGGVYIGEEPNRETVHLHTEKIKACVDLVEELSGAPAIIAYDTHADLERLQKAFPKAPHIGGGITTTRVVEIEKDWNDSKIPVLLIQPASAAHGLNLQRGGRAVIWHSLTWNLEYYEQLYQRVWRQGQEHTVYMYHIIARDTIDETIMRAIAAKDVVQKDLLKMLKEDCLR